MPETVKKKRIFQIAKELNISHADIISYLSKQGVEVSGLNSPVDSEAYEKILGEFSKDKEALDRFRKDQARRNARKATQGRRRLSRHRWWSASRHRDLRSSDPQGSSHHVDGLWHHRTAR